MNIQFVQTLQLKSARGNNMQLLTGKPLTNYLDAIDKQHIANIIQWNRLK